MDSVCLIVCVIIDAFWFITVVLCQVLTLFGMKINLDVYNLRTLIKSVDVFIIWIYWRKILKMLMYVHDQIQICYWKFKESQLNTGISDWVSIIAI